MKLGPGDGEGDKRPNSPECLPPSQLHPPLSPPPLNASTLRVFSTPPSHLLLSQLPRATYQPRQDVSPAAADSTLFGPNELSRSPGLVLQGGRRFLRLWIRRRRRFRKYRSTVSTPFHKFSLPLGQQRWMGRKRRGWKEKGRREEHEGESEARLGGESTSFALFSQFSSLKSENL